MNEQLTGDEQQEREQILTDQAYQTLLHIKGLQLDELKSLHGQSEAFELYLADRHIIYEDLIKQEAEENPIIWELYQRSKRDNPSKLEIPQAKAKRETSPQQRAELTTQAQKRKTFLKIWEQIKPDLTPEEQARLKNAMDQQLDTPL